MFIVCIRNTARSKSNPLLCTHVDSYMFNTLHPPGLQLVVTLIESHEVELELKMTLTFHNFT